MLTRRRDLVAGPAEPVVAFGGVVLD